MLKIGVLQVAYQPLIDSCEGTFTVPNSHLKTDILKLVVDGGIDIIVTGDTKIFGNRRSRLPFSLRSPIQLPKATSRMRMG